MRKSKVYEIAYKAIQESLEWTEDYKENYCEYINGIIYMAENVIEYLDEIAKNPYGLEAKTADEAYVK